MSENKHCGISCNGDIFLYIPCSCYGIIHSEFDQAVMVRCSAELVQLGAVCIEQINKCRKLSSEEYSFYASPEYVPYVIGLQEKMANNYGVTLKKFYSNMMDVSATVEGQNLIFSPTKHKSTNIWDVMSGSYDIVIPFSSSPEVIGAAVKYSVARCTGMGAYGVAKKLFPDGVPKSFDDYLQSLNLSLS